jgi:ABC-type sulfate transport system permease subunit
MSHGSEAAAAGAAVPATADTVPIAVMVAVAAAQTSHDRPARRSTVLIVIIDLPFSGFGP